MRIPHFWTIEDVKGFLGIPLEDHSRDAALREAIVSMSLLFEKKLKAKFSPWEYVLLPTEGLSSRRWRFSNLIHGIQRAVLAPLELWMAQPGNEVYDQKIEALEKLRTRALRIWETHPDHTIISSLKLADLAVGTLSCGVYANRLLTPGQLQVQIEKNKFPHLVHNKELILEKELDIFFVRSGRSPAPTSKVRVERGGESKRDPLFKTFMRSYRSVATKRIYLPEEFPAKKERLTQVVNDASAQILLFLCQDGLINLDEDPQARAFLFSYLSSFERKQQGGEGRLLPHLLRNYLPQEDYRAWRKYLGATIRGFAATEHMQERSYSLSDSTTMAEHLMIPAAADRLGVHWRSLYYEVQAGKVRTEMIAVDGKTYQIVPADEVERLQLAQTKKQFRRALIADRARQQGCSIASARRWVERQENRGLELVEIKKKINYALSKDFPASSFGDDADGVHWEYDRDAVVLTICLDPEADALHFKELDPVRSVAYATDESAVRVELLQISRGVRLTNLPEQKKIKEILGKLNIPYQGEGQKANVF